LLTQHLHQAASEFDRMQRELENARSRLRDQRSRLDVEEKDAQREIEQELRVLQARANSLSRVSALEVLTDHGWLPNYVFPEWAIAVKPGRWPLGQTRWRRKTALQFAATAAWW
jgi:DEAD/DEAH box helicase domain-containing protein